MGQAHFSVDTRLARLLGEAYRSSEVALKELIDNAWDADATNVYVTLPEPLTTDPILIVDDGSGMSAEALRREYLKIASDKRSRTGERTARFKRKVKGRKGIGKFAGLTVANTMEVTSIFDGATSKLTISKELLIESNGDLELVPLPLLEQSTPGATTGTSVSLSSLDQRLNFPRSERLREVLVYEYGRSENFLIHVNGVPLSVDDVPGRTVTVATSLPEEGAVEVNFTIADGKKLPKAPGIVLKVNGKTVGKPQMFGLDEDEEIPNNLLRRVYGEVEISGVEDFVSSDWSDITENSITYQSARDYVQNEVKKVLHSEHSRDMSLQKARLQRQINSRLQKLPEHRRHFAEAALERILKKFYGESDERVSAIAEVALDAMEHDAYWAVLEEIRANSFGDVSNFAAALDQFGLLELSDLARRARVRREFLDQLDCLISNAATLEADVHKALEANLWVFGRSYSLMSSNVTLEKVVQKYCDKKFSNDRSKKRPDLLLSQDYGDAYLLIEFKRPSHSITRTDISQAEQYRDDITSQMGYPAKVDLLLIGKGLVESVNRNNIQPGVAVNGYSRVVSAARNETEWLISTLG